jgi:hypothetical protein
MNNDTPNPTILAVINNTEDVMPSLCGNIPTVTPVKKYRDLRSVLVILTLQKINILIRECL